MDGSIKWQKRRPQAGSVQATVPKRFMACPQAAAGLRRRGFSRKFQRASVSGDIYIYIYIHIHIHIHTYIYIYIYIFLHQATQKGRPVAYELSREYINIYMYVCIYVYVCMYIHALARAYM
jgi:hypothetical protein